MAEAPRMLIETRLVDNPMLTEGLADLHQQTRGYVERRIEVTGNAITRIGALCYIKRREPHQEKAAERFKGLYEARYGSGNPAMDPGRVQVDTSPIAHDSGMAAKIDRTRDLEHVMHELGKPVYDRLVALLVLCIPAGNEAPAMPSGRRNDRHVSGAVSQALDDLDRLAAHWGYAMERR